MPLRPLPLTPLPPRLPRTLPLMPTTVILGGGIIGLATAHALAQLAPAPAHTVHLVEPSPTLFASASGNAAGFLAKDWFAPALAPLGALSFDLHRDLAAAHNGAARWGYAESVSYSLDRDDDADASENDEADTQGRNGGGAEGGVDWLLNNTSRATVAGRTASQEDPPDHPTWLRSKPSALQVISDRRSTAQVNPLHLCQFLLEQCRAAGVALHHPARATHLVRDPHSDTTSVRLELLDDPTRAGRTLDLPCDNIVIAAGCWTPQVYTTLFPNAGRVPRISPRAGYSVVLRSKHWPPAGGPARCHAVFTSDPAGFSPEIFSRAGGDVWLGGLNSTALALPARATDAVAEGAPVARLAAVARGLCGDDVEVLRAAVCFRPVSKTGRPVIARVHEADLGDGVQVPRGGGVFVAAGHGPWGIALSLGTGRVVAEMVLGRETSADVGTLARW